MKTRATLTEKKKTIKLTQEDESGFQWNPTKIFRLQNQIPSELKKKC